MPSDPLIRSTTLYSHHVDIRGLLAQVDSFVKLERTTISGVLFASGKDVLGQFHKSAFSGFKIREIHKADGLFMGELARNYGRKPSRSINGKFIIYKLAEPLMYLGLTDEDTTFLENGLHPLVHRAYPSLLLPFFDLKDMEMMLDALAKQTPHSRIMLTRFSQKSRIHSAAARKSRESDVRWTDVPYRDGFSEARQKNSLISKMSFDVVTEKHGASGKPFNVTALSGSFTRNGVFRCERDFKLFVSSVILTASQSFSERIAKLSDRARTKEKGFIGKPICIEFDDSLFNDVSQIKRLASVIGTLPNSSHSILHGNPYLHMVVTDSIDNSNFDVWVLSSSRITIAPQTICTGASLNRFADHLAREFDEGVVKDLSEVRY